MQKYGQQQVAGYCPNCRLPKISKEDLDSYARDVENVWKQLPGGSLFPPNAVPSRANGVALYTHQMSDPLQAMKIGGLPSKSPLANNALYTLEITGGKWLNL